MPQKRRNATPIAPTHARLLLAASLASIGLGMSGVFAMDPPGGQNQLNSTLDDFQLLGTQPTVIEDDLEVFYSHYPCMYCHGGYDIDVAPIDTWAVSLMAQSARDPVFHAALTIANQDANLAGNFCLRCHAPSQFARQAAENGELNIGSDEDIDGVNCTVCHRMVNPIYGDDSAVGYPGYPSDPDQPIISELASAGLLPESPGNAQLVLDTVDVRRGPYSDVPSNLHGINQSGNGVRIITSPYHKLSQLCGACHNVGNPLFHKGKDGAFHLNPLGAGEPTTDVLQTTPEQRTFSEWLHSDFADTGVVFKDGRFGGNLPDDQPIRTCQNCHMPPQTGGACGLYESPPFFERDDVGAHYFAGGNTWVLSAIRRQHGDSKADYYGITQERLEAANARTLQMLQDASDMELSQSGNSLAVRIINQSGHKLPTGYPEGRRMWLNVRFFDDGGTLIDEFGHYDYTTAELDTSETKVYEKKMGISEEVASVVKSPGGRIVPSRAQQLRDQGQLHSATRVHQRKLRAFRRIARQLHLQRRRLFRRHQLHGSQWRCRGSGDVVFSNQFKGIHRIPTRHQRYR